LAINCFLGFIDAKDSLTHDARRKTRTGIDE
jgi:hypothetical protein